MRTYDGSSSESQLLVAIYQVERQTGQSVTATMLALWSASASYLIAGSALLSHTLKNPDGAPEYALVALFPIPAAAFVGYHLILFAISLKRSESIELLESELMRSLPEEQRERLYERDRERIGSKVETNLTGWANAGPAMRIVSSATYIMPYLTAVLLICYSVWRLWIETGLLSAWTLVSIAVYIAIVGGVVKLGLEVIPARSSGRDESLLRVRMRLRIFWRMSRDHVEPPERVPPN